MVFLLIAYTEHWICLVFLTQHKKFVGRGNFYTCFYTLWVRTSWDCADELKMQPCKKSSNFVCTSWSPAVDTNQWRIWKEWSLRFSNKIHFCNFSKWHERNCISLLKLWQGFQDGLFNIIRYTEIFFGKVNFAVLGWVDISGTRWKPEAVSELIHPGCWEIRSSI